MFPWLHKGEPPPNKGKRASVETRRKLSDAKKRAIADGWRPANTGQKMDYSPEHRAKLSKNMRAAGQASRIHELGDAFPDEREGYIYVYAPGHPSANNVGYAHEHRLIAERALGRRLKRGEIVHHIDGMKSNNDPSNLLICSNAYHRWLHNQMSYLFQRMWFAGGVL